jgi:lipoprotein-anchoring transpeptidase ErfK/SrfK
MEKQKPYFLICAFIISFALLGNNAVSDMNLGSANIESKIDNAYHQVIGYLKNKKDLALAYCRNLVNGRFGASADIVQFDKTKDNITPYDVKSFNEEMQGIVFPNDEDSKEMIKIIPGKSQWERQEEARKAAEEAEAARKREEERKKLQVQNTSNLCTLSERYIEIDLSSQRLALCNMGNNEGTYSISSGSRKYPTPTGSYKINSKSLRAYSAKYNLYMPYWNSFIGNSYGIHELPEYPNGYKEGANLLGQAVSHGCVRLGVGAAATVYNWSPVGTSVIVHQ